MSDTKNMMDKRIKAIFNEKMQSAIKGRRVLDLGSNDGAISDLCLKFGASSVVGLDKDIKNIKKSKTLYPKIDFYHEDLDSGSIKKYAPDADVILCLGLLYLLNDQEILLNDILTFNNIKTVIVENVYSDYDIFIKNQYNILNTNKIKNIFYKNEFKLMYEEKYDINLQNKYMKNRICLLFNK